MAENVPLIGEGCCGVGGASRDSSGFGAIEEGLISRGDITVTIPSLMQGSHFCFDSSRPEAPLCSVCEQQQPQGIRPQFTAPTQVPVPPGWSQLPSGALQPPPAQSSLGTMTANQGWKKAPLPGPMQQQLQAALSPSEHQGLFQGVNSSHEVAKVLEFQPQHQYFQ